MSITHIKEDLRKFLLRRLPSLCDAAPDALSSFIFALLEKNVSQAVLVDQLREFFVKSEPTSFVGELFREINRLQPQDIPVREPRHQPASRSRERNARSDRPVYRSRSNSRSRSRGHRRRSDSPPRRRQRSRSPANRYDSRRRDSRDSGHSRPHQRDANGRGPLQYREKPHSSHHDSASFQRPHNTTIHVSAIPAELNSLMKLISHFETFGEVKNIQVAPERNCAFVQFVSHASAKAAIRSPEAVCGNRFIRVMWAKYDAKDLSSGLNIEESEQQTRALKDADLSVRADEMKSHISGVVDTKSALLGKLKAMKGDNPARERQISELDEQVKKMCVLLGELDSAKQEYTDSSEDKEVFRRVFARLEAVKFEAIALNILDEAGNLKEKPTLVSGSRGRGTPRGRGVVRGRGRGRGRGGFAGATGTGASMTLDNRSRVLMVGYIPTQYYKEQILRSHFQSFGSLVRVEMLGTGNALVEYKMRPSAQKALNLGMDLLGHQLSLRWHDTDKAKKDSDDEDEDEDRSWHH